MSENRVSEVREVNDKHMFDALSILRSAADSCTPGWSKIGMLVNQDAHGPGVLLYAALVWKDQKYDHWMPDQAIADITNVMLDWQAGLSALDSSKWASMFLGLAPEGESFHAVWLPEYSAAQDKWRIRGDRPNWPVVEQALKEM